MSRDFPSAMIPNAEQMKEGFVAFRHRAYDTEVLITAKKVQVTIEGYHYGDSFRTAPKELQSDMEFWLAVATLPGAQAAGAYYMYDDDWNYFAHPLGDGEVCLGGGAANGMLIRGEITSVEAFKRWIPLALEVLRTADFEWFRSRAYRTEYSGSLLQDSTKAWTMHDYVCRSCGELVTDQERFECECGRIAHQGCTRTCTQCEEVYCYGCVQVWTHGAYCRDCAENTCSYCGDYQEDKLIECDNCSDLVCYDCICSHEAVEGVYCPYCWEDGGYDEEVERYEAEAEDDEDDDDDVDDDDDDEDEEVVEHWRVTAEAPTGTTTTPWLSLQVEEATEAHDTWTTSDSNL